MQVPNASAAAAAGRVVGIGLATASQLLTDSALGVTP